MKADVLQIILALGSLVFEKGIPFVQNAITAWSATDEDITVEKIEALKITKEPEAY